MAGPNFTIVTIDGGAASGKSSTARALSERFNLLHVDTGAFYRTVTLALLNAGITTADTTRLEEILPTLRIGTRISGREAKMVINDLFPGDEIRNSEVNRNVSLFAANPAVRSFLLSYQRNQAAFAQENGFPGLVMEGRDIGSVIFPEAEFRFFLTADVAERIRRRSEQGQADEISQRDRLDTERKTAPLLCPEGATSIDTTHLPLDQVVEKISKLLEQKLPRISK